MRKPLLLSLAAVLGVASALAVAACGDSGPQPSLDKLTAAQLQAALKQVEQNFDQQSCSVAAIDAQDFQDAVDSLPSDVDPDTRKALQDGAANLTKLLDDPANCEQTTTTESSTTETTESTTETTAPTDTTTTETTTPDTTTTPTQPDTTGGGIQPPSGGTGL